MSENQACCTPCSDARLGRCVCTPSFDAIVRAAITYARQYAGYLMTEPEPGGSHDEQLRDSDRANIEDMKRAMRFALAALPAADPSRERSGS